MIAATATVLRACRPLIRRPRYFLLGAATLALAVAAFFATFTLVDALLLSPPAFSHHASVVMYGEEVRVSSPRSLSMADYDAIGQPRGMLSRGLALPVERASVRSGTRAGLLAVQRVDAGFLPTLGVTPALGSLDLAQGGRDGLLLSWRLWMAWFRGDPSVTGREVIVDGHALPIVGVLPAAYRVFEDVDVLLPFHPIPGATSAVPNSVAVARLATGATEASLTERIRQAAASADRTGDGLRLGVTPIRETLTRASAPTLWFFLACALLVLATACGNLANLTLARALERSRVTALRQALGAGAWAAWAPAAAEAALIGVAALIAGDLIGHALVRAGEAYLPDTWRVNAGPLPIGWRVYTASAVVTFAATTLAAIGGTLHEHGDALMHEHIGGGRRHLERVTAGGIRVFMVQVQLALATVLLSLCVVRAVETWRQEKILPGFDLASAAAARFRPDPAHFDAVGPLTNAMAAIGYRARALTDVVSAGVTTQLPAGTHFNVSFAGQGNSTVETQFAAQTPGARAALGLRLIEGRDLTVSDTAGAPTVMLVNETFLASVPGAALGSTVRKVSRSLGSRDLRIVGVVADTRDAGPGAAPRPWAIVPFAQLPPVEFASFRGLFSYYLVVRTADEAALETVDLAAAVRQVAPWLVLDPQRPLSRAWHDSHTEADRDTWLATWFASVGLGVSLLGLYSAQRVEVASRRRDMALYAALGAAPVDLFGLCLSRGISRASQGIGLGLAAAFAWSRWPPQVVASDVRFDPSAALIVAVAMLVLACGATLAPALRSASTPAWLVLRNH